MGIIKAIAVCQGNKANISKPAKISKNIPKPMVTLAPYFLKNLGAKKQATMLIAALTLNQKTKLC